MPIQEVEEIRAKDIIRKCNIDLEQTTELRIEMWSKLLKFKAKYAGPDNPLYYIAMSRASTMQNVEVNLEIVL